MATILALRMTLSTWLASACRYISAVASVWLDTVRDSHNSLFYSTLQINYGDHNPAVHQPGFLRERLGELLPTHFITAKRRGELERRLLTEHAQTNKDEAEV